MGYGCFVIAALFFSAGLVIGMGLVGPWLLSKEVKR